MVEFLLVIVLLLLLFFTLVILYKIFLDLKNSYDDYKEDKENKAKKKDFVQSNLKYIKSFSIVDILNRKKKKNAK